jgi:hypothetical protein
VPCAREKDGREEAAARWPWRRETLRAGGREYEVRANSECF